MTIQCNAGLYLLNVVKRDRVGGGLRPGHQLGAGHLGAAHLLAGISRAGQGGRGQGLLLDGRPAGGADQGSPRLKPSSGAFWEPMCQD